MFVTTFTISVYDKQAFLSDTGETRPAVEATLARLQALRFGSADDPGLRKAIDEVTNSPHVAAVWLFTPDGRIVHDPRGEGMFGLLGPKRVDRAEQLASIDVRGTLDSISEAELTGEQRAMLLAASAIRAEWEHNVIYRHMVRRIRNADGKTVVLVGVGYAASVSDDSRIGIVGLVIGALARLIGFVLYWFSLALWVFLDARSRGQRVWPWTAFVLIGNFVALIAYLLVRPPAGKSPAAYSLQPTKPSKTQVN